jgi:hypothetical protein
MIRAEVYGFWLHGKLMDLIFEDPYQLLWLTDRKRVSDLELAHFGSLSH